MSAERKCNGYQYHESPFTYKLHRTDIQVDRDPFGLGSRCAGGANDREKSLCCNTPKNLDPFLPVSLDKLFPTEPPKGIDAFAPQIMLE